MPSKTTPAAAAPAAAPIPSAKAFFMSLKDSTKALDKGLLDGRITASNANLLGQMAQATGKIVVKQNGQPQGLAEVHAALPALKEGKDATKEITEEQYARSLARMLGKFADVFPSWALAWAFTSDYKEVLAIMEAQNIELPAPVNAQYLEMIWGAARLAAVSKKWAYGKASKAERSGDASAL